MGVLVYIEPPLVLGTSDKDLRHEFERCLLSLAGQGLVSMFGIDVCSRWYGLMLDEGSEVSDRWSDSSDFVQILTIRFWSNPPHSAAMYTVIDYSTMIHQHSKPT